MNDFTSHAASVSNDFCQKSSSSEAERGPSYLRIKVFKNTLRKKKPKKNQRGQSLAEY